MNPSDDPFLVLGLQRSASLEEVKRAFRRLAMRWHPDRNPAAAAETEFKRIKAAYELILDPEAYAKWLETQPSATAGGDSSGAAPGDDQTQSLILTLEEAAQGCVKSIELVRSSRCSQCQGSGRVRLTHSTPCGQCNGIGRVRDAGRGSRRCESCAGRGYVREADCADCEGSGWRKQSRALSVKVPPGIVHGERLRLAGQAHRTPGDGHGAGDLYLEIRLAQHPLFELRQRDLHCTVPVSIFRLLTGGKIEVPTLQGTAELDALAYPGHDLEYRLQGQGFPRKHGRAGDLIVRLNPVYPLHLSPAQRVMLEQLDAALADAVAQRAPELAEWTRRLQERRHGVAT